MVFEGRGECKSTSRREGDCLIALVYISRNEIGLPTSWVAL